MSFTPLAAADPQRPGSLGVLLAVLRRTGWRDVTPTDDRYLEAGAMVLEPIKPKGDTSHPVARIATSGQAIGLVTFTPAGAELDRCTWSFITPHNLERAMDYMHAAVEAAAAS